MRIENEIDDILIGDNQFNYLNGGQGDDLLIGLGGNDYLISREGNDVILGGEGNTDRFDETNAKCPMEVSLVTGTSLKRAGHPCADPAVTDDVGQDILYEVEAVWGGNADDEIWGNDSPNQIRGGSGNDEIHGGGGSDLLIGSQGDDQIWGDYGEHDEFYERLAACAMEVDLSGPRAGSNADGVSQSGCLGTDDLWSIEDVWTGDGSDIITGNVKDNRLIGGAGRDTISGGDGNDILCAFGVNFPTMPAGEAACNYVQRDDETDMLDGEGNRGDEKGDTCFYNAADRDTISECETFSDPIIPQP